MYESSPYNIRSPLYQCFFKDPQDYKLKEDYRLIESLSISINILRGTKKIRSEVRRVRTEGTKELALAKSGCLSDHFHRVNQILRQSDLS